MKYIKTYRLAGHDMPNVGDYVVCENEKHIGIITEIRKKGSTAGSGLVYRNNSYQVEYKAPLSYSRDEKRYRWYYDSDILFYSSDKKECEIYMNAKKFNM